MVVETKGPKMNSVFILLCLVCAMAAADGAICTEFKSGQKITQKFLGEFIVDIEVVQKEANLVQHMTMYYSKFAKTIRLDILENTKRSSMYYYFELNEILTFDFSDTNRGKCNVETDLSNMVNTFMFGGTTRQTTKPNIPVALAAFHLVGLSGFGSNIKDHYIGKAIVRMKASKKYTSCQRWVSPENDIVLNVTHYFAEDAYQFPYSDHKWSTLLSMEVEGTGKVDNIRNHHIDHVYNYFNFRRFDDGDTSLETPEGVVCQGRKTMKQFPPMPPFVKFTGEYIEMASQSFVTKEEVYDFTSRYGIVKLKNMINSDADKNKLTYVFNFATGEMSTIDNVRLSCTTGKIADFTGDTDMFTVQRHKAVMYSPQKYYMADPKDYTYLGKKVIRGMLTDMWVAKYAMDPQLSDAVVQLHFAPPTLSWNNKNPNFVNKQWPVPVKAKVYVNDSDLTGNTENVFHVDYNHLPPDYIDMTPCYKHKHQFQVVLKGKRSDIVNSQLEEFIEKNKISIAERGLISWLQISKMKPFYTTNNIYLEFVVGGNDKSKVDTAVQRIKDGFNNNDLKMMVRGKGQWKQALPLVKVATLDLAAVGSNGQINSDTASGYTKGAMAGLGIGMIIVGVLGGAGVGFAHGKYFG